VNLNALDLMLLATLCRATWNAFVKMSQDRLTGLAAINVTSLVFGLLMLPWVPLPDATGALILAASVLVHLLYKLLLPLAYKKGDLTLIYPAIRGLAPLMVWGIAMLMLGEQMSLVEIVGMAAICLGILTLTAEHGWMNLAVIRPLLFAILTGMTIAVYKADEKHACF
jgi:multidrug transporter EmrE-like cation transporter